MDTQLARNLIALDNAFYRANAESFSATRSTPWAGWSEMLHDVRGAFGASPGELSVLDLACGNMRFAAFLAEELPKTHILYHGIDASSDLAALAHAATPAAPRSRSVLPPDSRRRSSAPTYFRS